MSNTNQSPARRFRLALLDDATHDRLWVRRFTKAGVIGSLVAVLLAIFLLSFALIAFTPLRQMIPGYPDSYSRQSAIRNAIRIDSLRQEIAKWDLYTTNLRLVLSGESTLPIDSLLALSAQTQQENEERLRQQDALLRAEVVEADRFDISATPRRLPLEGIDFFPPLKGEVVRHFHAASHPWVEIEAPEGSVVMAMLDGTVLYSGYDPSEGYILVIAHAGQLVSVYKYNQSALRQEGDRVQAGTPVATVGGPHPAGTSACLGLELWYQSERVDPAQYIAF